MTEAIATATDDLLRVEIRFKNGRLYDAILDADVPIFGAKSAAGQAGMARGRVKAFCELHDFDLPPVYELLNLRKGPFVKTRDGVRLRGICQRLCALLERDPDWLFPVALYERTWRPLSAYLGEASLADATHRLQQVAMQTPLLLSAPAEPTTALLAEDLSAALDRSLVTLSPREERVIRARFGLTPDGKQCTLHEIGQMLGVQRERVRQIEAKALRKLRHPVSSRRLRGFVKGAP